MRAAAKKPAAKKAPAKKASAKRAVSGRVSAKKAPSLERKAVEPGFKRGRSGIYLPEGAITPVPPSKIKAGLLAAKQQLTEMLDELTNITSDFSVSEIELQVSFTADGKFLGVGVGGATSITLRIAPDDNY